MSRVPVPLLRLDSDVSSLLVQLQSSFLSLVSHSNSLIGPNSPESNDEMTGMPNIGPADFSQLSFSAVQSSLLRQQFQSNVAVSSFLDASERLLALIDQLKLSALLNDRSRFQEAAKRIKEIKQKTKENNRQTTQLLESLDKSELNEIEKFLEISLGQTIKLGSDSLLPASNQFTERDSQAMKEKLNNNNNNNNNNANNASANSNANNPSPSLLTSKISSIQPPA